jgi:chromosomal replication initiation ATPase DnaA
MIQTIYNILYNEKTKQKTKLILIKKIINNQIKFIDNNNELAKIFINLCNICNINYLNVLKSKSRVKIFVTVRKALSYIALNDPKNKYNYNQIANFLKLKSHATIMHHFKTARNLIETGDVHFSQIINIYNILNEKTGDPGPLNS